VPDSPDLKNRFVARAVLYNETTDALARRIAAATEQPPANTQDMSGDPAKLAAAWHFSPSQNPAADFWAMHDQQLQQNLSQVPPDAPPEIVTAAHNDAETKALNAVYPYRGELIGVGSRVIEDQVAQADRIKRLVDNHLAGVAADTNGSPQAAGPAPDLPLPMPPGGGPQ
jgi:hypothetical protein